MRRVNIHDLVPGMVTAEDIYNFNDQLILPKGTILNDQAITKLVMYSVLNLRIEEEVTLEPVDEIVAANTSYYDKVRATKEYVAFKEEFNRQLVQFQGLLNDIVKKNADPDVSSMLAGTLSLVETAKNSANLLEMLHAMKDYDDSTYVHSLNVALLCNLLAGWLRLSPEEVHLATLCGLLHDIGKLKVPDELIKKPAKLTNPEFERIKAHAKDGYILLKDKNVDVHVKNSALMHHERCDGSGYPFKVLADQIDPYAKMVSIADVYDAMTSPRVYRGPLCPFKVISIFEEEGLQRYESQYIMTFLEHIVNSYIMTDVKLSDGQVGKIVYINKHCLSKPTVQTADGFLDLSKEADLYIDAIM